MSLPLHHLVYQSSATVPLGETELERILTRSRAWNTAHDLTGVLIYSNGNIMQVLEGPEDEVRYIFDRISQDRRHREVLKLSDGAAKQRYFSQWSMGFKAVNPADFSHLTGYLNLREPLAWAGTVAAPDAGLHDLLAGFVGATGDPLQL